MLNYDSEEDCDAGSLWISTKSLRDAANIKTCIRRVPSRHSSKHTSPGMSPSHNSSITMEWKPNTNINKSISFSFIHEGYKNDEDLGACDYEESPDQDHFTFEGDSENSKIRYLEENHDEEIRLLKDDL